MRKRERGEREGRLRKRERAAVAGSVGGGGGGGGITALVEVREHAEDTRAALHVRDYYNKALPGHVSHFRSIFVTITRGHVAAFSPQIFVPAISAFLRKLGDTVTSNCSANSHAYLPRESTFVAIEIK